MKLFLISDLHLFHKKIREFEPIRSVLGETDEETAESIISRWNSVVEQDDIVFNLGDFAFAVATNFEKIVTINSRLNGRKILIAGNHDRKVKRSAYLEKLGFEHIFFHPIELELGYVTAILSHEPVAHVPEGWVNFHGHTHSEHVVVGKPSNDSHPEDDIPQGPGAYINCSIEVLPNLAPILLQETDREPNFH